MTSTIIVFSHLQWNFADQRPQHILSHIARHHPILYFEEPVPHPGEAFFKTFSPSPNVVVCQPHIPIGMPGFHDDHLPHLREMLHRMLRQFAADGDDTIAWLQTPMALPLLKPLAPRLVVYDCMAEPAVRADAPGELQQREHALLKAADVVFTAGHSVCRAMRERHPEVHCFPGSVDAGHFVQALDRSNSHPAHKDIPGPRLGFYGALDERIDADLIAALADAHPVWQIVLVGPVLRIDPASLPQRPNIHYLGPQPYEALPQFLAGWDVCLLPYALNQATRHVSPVRTLEYMAAELPIVSTPVADVVDAYGDVVTIAEDARGFIAACEAALLASPEEALAKVKKMRAVLATASWDVTVKRMRELLNDVRGRRTGRAMKPFAPLAKAGALAAYADPLAAPDRVRAPETELFPSE